MGSIGATDICVLLALRVENFRIVCCGRFCLQISSTLIALCFNSYLVMHVFLRKVVILSV